MNAGRGTSIFQNGLVWFGAAVSIAEIQTGIDIAAGGGGSGIDVATAAWAIIAGHLLGGLLLFAVGCIGARLRASAMDCVKLPFGRAGAGFLAALNIVQLLGWTAVMIAQGAEAASALVPRLAFPAASAIIGVLVAAWVFIGLGGVSRINAVAMALLFILTLYLTFNLFTPDVKAAAGESETSFWPIFEFSAAMPLSWLPLVADYTKDAHRPRLAPAVSAAVYTLVSCWMFAIGVSVGRHFAGEGFAQAILACGAGAAGIFVVVFSTVTTTFLDAYSAGESARSIHAKVPPKLFAVAVTVAGTLVAIFVGMDRYLDFLYLIASVFAPMAAVQVVDWGLRAGARSTGQVAINFIAWLVGLAVYHIALAKGCPVGATLPSMISAAAITALARLTTKH